MNFDANMADDMTGKGGKKKKKKKKEKVYKEEQDL
jgi:hypothetical protein